MPSPPPSRLLLRAAPPSPRLAASPYACFAPPSLATTRAPPPSLHPPLRRLPAPRRRTPPRATVGVVEGARRAPDEDLVPIARCYDTGRRLARLELAGAARREQAVAAAAAADGGAAAEAHLAAGAEAMVLEAVLPGPGGTSASSTRVILQAEEVKDKASQIKKQFGSEFFFENKSDSDTMLAMAFKQVVMQRLSNFRLQVFSPGSERDFQDLGKPRKVSMDFFSVFSSDGKLLASLAEAIFSCVVEDARKNHLGDRGSLFQKRQLNCSIDSSVCIHRISEAEIVRNATRYLESFNTTKSPQNVHKTKNGWWPVPIYESLVKIGGPEFVIWANEYIPTYKLQINAKAFDNTNLEGSHGLEGNTWEVLLTHSQLVELGSVIDMYFEDEFTLPGKNFHSHWNLDRSKIKKNKGYLKNLFTFLAGGCIILAVAVFAQLCWPSLRDKRLLKGSSNASSSQSFCSDINALDSSEIQDHCESLIKKMKDSYGCPDDVMVDAHIGAWIGELPDCFKGINSADDTASVNVQRPDTFSQENQSLLAPINIKTPDLEQNDITQETLQNIASFQVVMSEEGRVVGFQPTNRPAVNHWSTNPLATLLYQGRTLSPGILEPALKISRPAKAVPIELLMSVNQDSFFALARPVQDLR